MDDLSQQQQQEIASELNKRRKLARKAAAPSARPLSRGLTPRSAGSKPVADASKERVFCKQRKALEQCREVA